MARSNVAAQEIDPSTIPAIWPLLMPDPWGTIITAKRFKSIISIRFITKNVWNILETGPGKIKKWGRREFDKLDEN